MNFIPLVVSWVVVATSVLALALYRRTIASKQDDYLHVNTDVGAQQMAMAKKLEVIDHWGKILTIVAAVFGALLLGLFMYDGWMNPPRPS
jgi:hypothetical protein